MACLHKFLLPFFSFLDVNVRVRAKGSSTARVTRTDCLAQHYANAWTVVIQTITGPTIKTTCESKQRKVHVTGMAKRTNLKANTIWPMHGTLTGI